MKNLIAALVLSASAVFAQTYGLSPFPKFYATDNNGNPCSGCQLFSYVAGTTTPQATYSNSSGTVNANPVILDASGRADVWLSAASYKLVLESATGATIWTVDNVVSPTAAPYLPLAGGTVSGAVLSTGATNLGNTSNPFGTLYLQSGLVMGGATVLDASRNATVQNLTINGTCSGCGTVSGFLPLSGGTMTGNLIAPAIFTNLIGAQVGGPGLSIAVANLAINGSFSCAGTGCPSGGGGGSFLPLSGGTMTGNILMGGFSNLEIAPQNNLAANLGDSAHYWGNLYAQNVFLNPGFGSMQWGSAGNLSNLNSVGGATFNNAVTINGNLSVSSCTGCGGGGGGGANTALSNLTTTSINQSLLPVTSGTNNIGAANAYWSNGFFGGQVEGQTLETFLGTPASIIDFFTIQNTQLHIFDIKDSVGNIVMRFNEVTTPNFIFNGTVEPNGSATYNLGAASLAWQTLFLSSGVTISGTAGATCSGSPTASFASIGGIVTHC